MGLSDLKGLVKKDGDKKTSKKSKAVTLDPEPVQEACEEWAKADAAIREATSRKEQAEVDILEYAEPAWIEACRAQGEAQNSCNVGQTRMTFKGKSQFAVKSTLDPDRLKAAFGDEYDNYFMEKEGPMKLSPEALANESIVNKLTEALGKIQEEFPDTPILSMTTDVVTKDALFNDYVLRSDKHDDIDNKLRAAGVKRTKVSFNTR